MSPVTKRKPKADPQTFTAVKIPARGYKSGGRRQATVSIDPARDHVVVEWVADDPVAFTAEDLEKAISRTEEVNAKHDDVWMSLVDTVGHAFVCQIRGGRLYAGGEVIDGDQPSVAWKAMSDALTAAMKFLSTPK